MTVVTKPISGEKKDDEKVKYYLKSQFYLVLKPAFSHENEV